MCEQQSYSHEQIINSQDYCDWIQFNSIQGLPDFDGVEIDKDTI